MKNRSIQVLFVLTVLLLISSCIKKTDSSTQNKVWDSVVNQEFRNYDVFAGSGLYFYEDNSFKYCTYKIYGSGVPVAFEHTSRVLIKKNGIMQISLPKTFENTSDPSELSGDSVFLELEYNKNGIKFGDHFYSHHTKEVSMLSQYEIEQLSTILQIHDEGI